MKLAALRHDGLGSERRRQAAAASRRAWTAKKTQQLPAMASVTMPSSGRW